MTTRPTGTMIFVKSLCKEPCIQARPPSSTVGPSALFGATISACVDAGFELPADIPYLLRASVERVKYFRTKRGGGSNTRRGRLSAMNLRRSMS